MSYGPLLKNLISPTKSKAHNQLHCPQRTTKKCTQNLKFVHVVFDKCESTDRHTDMYHYQGGQHNQLDSLNSFHITHPNTKHT